MGAAAHVVEGCPPVCSPFIGTGGSEICCCPPCNAHGNVSCGCVFAILVVAGFAVRTCHCSLVAHKALCLTWSPSLPSHQVQQALQPCTTPEDQPRRGGLGTGRLERRSKGRGGRCQDLPVCRQRRWHRLVGRCCTGRNGSLRRAGSRLLARCQAQLSALACLA